MNRLRAVIALALVIAAGLGVRSHLTHGWPGLLTKAAGDALWTTAVYMLLRVCFPRLPTARLATIALAISTLVEFTQLYHAPWIESVRGTWLGGIALGHGFHFTDLVWYALGTLLGIGLDQLFRPGNRDRTPANVNA